MTRSKVAHSFANLLLVELGSAFTAHAGDAQSAPGDKAGEASARAYYEQQGNQFAAQAPVITSKQTTDAMAEGRLEGPAARQLSLPKKVRQVSLPRADHRGGDQWTLSALYVVRDI